MSDQVSTRRLLVVAADPSAANPVLRLDFLDAVIVEPQADQSLPADTANDFDDLVVADFDGDPTVLVQRLAHASRHVRGDGTVSVALTTDIADVNGFADPSAWSEALSGYTADGIVEGGALLRLRPSKTPDPTTGPLLVGAIRAAAATRSDTRDAPLAVRSKPVDSATDDTASAAAASTPADELAAAKSENEELTRRVRSLEQSRAVRATRRLRQLRAAGPARAAKELTGRELSVLVGAAVVALVAVIVLAVVLSLLASNAGVGIGLTLILVVVVLAFLRGELARRRVSGRLRALDNRMTTANNKQFTALKRIAARTRAHQTLLGSLDRRFMTVTASSNDTAHVVATISEDLRQAHPERVRKAVFNDSTKQYEQLQAAMNLFALVDVQAAVPPLRGWAVSPDALLVVLTELLTRRPALVLECGSGSSTLWTALAIRKFGLDTRIVSLDHQAQYKADTEATLARHGVADLAEVRLAPLVPTGIPGHDTPWYDVSVVSDLTDVGLLFVDGPPEASGPLARYPAVPLLLPHLASDAVIVLDDAIRADEKAAVARWLEENPSMSTEYLRTEKGTSVVRRS